MYVTVCGQDMTELGLVIDSSASIWPQNFIIGLKFLVDVLEPFDIGPGRGQVSYMIKHCVDD
jgi:hypothetical protein